MWDNWDNDKLFYMSDFKFGEITEKIIGGSFRVHNTLGCGFQEVIYQRAMEIENAFGRT